MKKIYVGPKQSNIEYSDFFDESITLFGNNTITNHSYESFLTFEYWNPDNKLKEITIYNRALSNIKDTAEIMAHNPLLVSKCNLPDNLSLVCLNDLSLLEILDDKINTHNLMKNIVPMIDYTIIKGKEFDYNKLSKSSEEIIIQHPKGSGGSKTFFCNNENHEIIKSLLLPEDYYSISKYYRNNIPYNIHCLIGKKQIEILPPSIQELEIIDKIEYIGSDYNIDIPWDVRTKLVNYSSNICKKLQELGYLGVVGIDYIYTDNELFFIEINPRFQGSTKQIDKLLKESNLPSIFEYNYNCFYSDNLISTKNMKLSLFNN